MKKKKVETKTTPLTPKEYADLRGYTDMTYVNRMIRDGNLTNLPNVIKVQKISRFNLLMVKADAKGNAIVPKISADAKRANGMRAMAKLK